MLFSTLFLASKHPDLGFSAAATTNSLIISSVNLRSSPTQVLRVGDELLTVGNSDNAIKLTAFDGTAEPDTLTSFTEYRRFLQRQSEIWSIIASPEIRLTIRRDAQLHELVITPTASRTLKQLPALFWYQVFCGSLIMLIGIATWCYAHASEGTRLLAFAGTAIALAIFTSAIYTTRQLALPPTEFLYLSRANQLGSLLFAGFGIAMLCYYPNTLSRYRMDIFLPASAALVYVLNHAQIIDNVNTLLRYPLLAFFGLSIYFAYGQWRSTFRHPVQRARLKWFFYASFTGTAFFLLLTAVPPLVSSKPIIPQQYGWGLLAACYIGIAIGVLRFQLFDLDRWVLHGWIWFFCGIAMVIVDAVLVIWLRLESTLSLLITVTITGWFYFPLRQRLLSHMQPRPAAMHRLLPTIMSKSLGQMGHEAIDPIWPPTLAQIYEPLRLEQCSGRLENACIVDNGLGLHIPGLNDACHFQLSFAHHGQRLFTADDLTTAATLHQFFSYAKRYQQAHSDGMAAERKRLSADLHDDLGNQLLSLLYQTKEPVTATMTRTALLTLRMVMQDLQHSSATLAEAAQVWQEQLNGLLLHEQVSVKLSMDSTLDTQVITAPVRSQLSRIIRELVINGQRHAKAKHISLTLTRQAQYLRIDYRDDGIGLMEETLSAKSGMGLKNIQYRCANLQGHLQHLPTKDGTHLRCELDLFKEASS